MAGRSCSPQLHDIMWNILGGAFLIALGLFMGDSVFGGHPSVRQLAFDGFGVFVMALGVLQLWRERNAPR